MEKVLKIKAVSIVLCFIVSSAWGIDAIVSLVGMVAPPFSVETADGKVTDNGVLKGKVVVLFYESKDAMDKSRPLKNHLNGFYARLETEMQNTMERMAVLACRGVVWPVKEIWKKRMLEESRQWGVPVYGDWDGVMEKAFGFDAEDTNLIVMDRHGVVRYASTGAVSPREADALVNLLAKLLKNRHGLDR